MAIVKPELVKINIMSGNRNIMKLVSGKLKSGMVTYPGMDVTEPIVWFGQPQYALFNLKQRKIELFYDATRKILIKLKDLGGTPNTDAIADLTRNFTVALQNTKSNMNTDDSQNNTLKWAMGFAFLIMFFAIIGAYLIISHVHPAGAVAAAHTASTMKTITNDTIIHIPT